MDPRTGATLKRYPNVRGEAGAHGIEYDRFEAGRLWIATPKSKTISQVRTADWSVVYTIPLAYGGAHGMVRLEDAIWAVVTTGVRIGWDRIVKLSLKDGKELDRIDIGESLPEPHGMSVYGEDLLYCSATSGWVAKITL